MSNLFNPTPGSTRSSITIHRAIWASSFGFDCSSSDLLTSNALAAWALGAHPLLHLIISGVFHVWPWSSSATTSIALVQSGEVRGLCKLRVDLGASVSMFGQTYRFSLAALTHCALSTAGSKQKRLV